MIETSFQSFSLSRMLHLFGSIIEQEEPAGFRWWLEAVKQVGGNLSNFLIKSSSIRPHVAKHKNWNANWRDWIEMKEPSFQNLGSCPAQLPVKMTAKERGTNIFNAIYQTLSKRHTSIRHKNINSDKISQTITFSERVNQICKANVFLKHNFTTTTFFHWILL